MTKKAKTETDIFDLAMPLETALKWMNERVPEQDKLLHCCKCDGWPIDSGAMFSLVLFIKDGKPVFSAICETCWLKRLQSSATRHNALTGDPWQIEIPKLNIKKKPNYNRPPGHNPHYETIERLREENQRLRKQLQRKQTVIG